MPIRQKAIIWTNAHPVHWCIYAALGWDELTPKQLEMDWGVLSTVSSDALVLKHQTISVHSADKTFIALDQFHTQNYIHGEHH